MGRKNKKANDKQNANDDEIHAKDEANPRQVNENKANPMEQIKEEVNENEANPMVEVKEKPKEEEVKVKKPSLFRRLSSYIFSKVWY